MALIYPLRLSDDQYVFRALLGDNWVDKLQDPWAITQHAFIRRGDDKSGISVRPSLESCCLGVSPKNIQGVAKLRVSDVRMLVNPVTGAPLDVIQDSDRHANIVNAPYHDSDPYDALDMADDLAAMADILNGPELWAALDRSGLRPSVIARLAEKLGLRH